MLVPPRSAWKAILLRVPRHASKALLLEKLTIKQVAQELGVDERTVRRWIANGELPYVGFDIRGRYLIARTD